MTQWPLLVNDLVSRNSTDEQYLALGRRILGLMQEIISKTDENYLILDFCLLLVPAANLNRPPGKVATPCKA